jgi:hypothetical protein
VPTQEDEALALLERRVEASRRVLREQLHPADSSADKPAGGGWSGLISNTLMPEINQFAERHPVALLAGSALAGALLVWARPWRGAIGTLLLSNAVSKISYIASSNSTPHLIQYWMNRRKPVAARSAPPTANTIDTPG